MFKINYYYFLHLLADGFDYSVDVVNIISNILKLPSGFLICTM